jgi:hypothetical protein
MISYLVIVMFAVLWLIAVGIERVAFKHPYRSWRQGLIFSALILLLHLDVAIGYFVAYRPMVKQTGDGEVLKHVSADGFLDPYGEFAETTLQRTEPGFALFQPNYPFRYVELETRHARYSRLLAPYSSFPSRRDAEYVHYFRADSGSPECARFDALPDVVELRRQYMIPDGACIASSQTRDPISKFEAREIAFGRLNPDSMFPIDGSVTALVDRQSGEAIARCSVFGYRPLISRLIFIEFVHWSHNPACLGSGFWPLITNSIQVPTNKNTEEK